MCIISKKKKPSPNYCAIVISNRMNSFHLLVIFPGSSGTKSPFFLIFGRDPAEGCLSHLNNSNIYYGTNEGKIVLAVLYKLWKHHTKLLKEMCQRNENKDQQINRKNPTFQIGQSVMDKNHANHTFKPTYLLDYRVLKYLIMIALFC